MIRDNNLGRQSPLDRIGAAWRDAVGRSTAEKTRLVSFRGGVLTVEADSSALAQELEVYYKRELVARLQAGAGVAVTDLRCRVGRGAAGDT